MTIRSGTVFADNTVLLGSLWWAGDLRDCCLLPFLIWELWPRTKGGKRGGAQASHIHTRFLRDI